MPASHYAISRFPPSFFARLAFRRWGLQSPRTRAQICSGASAPEASSLAAPFLVGAEPVSAHAFTPLVLPLWRRISTLFVSRLFPSGRGQPLPLPFNPSSSRSPQRPNDPQLLSGLNVAPRSSARQPSSLPL